MISGIVNVYKEKGFTSFDVVAKLRGILKTRKIGHTGTLDPEAEGVLPVCLGKATKVCDLLTDKSKEYETVMLLGVTTDTQDKTGTVLSERAVEASEEEVRKTVLSMQGTYAQVPPMYSALKVDGRKLCDLARNGIMVERAAREVQIHEIEILSVELPRVKMRVFCSKGTYIRTLCHDIGEKLGCGACMETLLRTRVSGFTAKEAKTLAQIEEAVRQQAKDVPPGQWTGETFDFIRPIDSVFLEYEKGVVKKDYQKLLYNGNRLPVHFFTAEPHRDTPLRVYDEDGQFIGIYQYMAQQNDYKPVKVFMES